MKKYDMDKLILDADNIKPINPVINKLLSIIRDKNSSVRDLKKIISLDEILTSKVIKMSNTPFYNRSGNRINSIEEALVRLGNKALINIVFAEGMSENLANQAGEYDLKRGDLWRHSVSCAFVSQHLCKKISYENSEIAFTASIVHDIGKTLMGDMVKNNIDQLNYYIFDQKKTLTESEKELFGFSHSELGAELLKNWNFPSEIFEAVKYHHNPIGSQDNKLLSDIIYLSNIITLMAGVGLGLGGLNYHSYKEVFDTFDLKENELQRFILTVADEQARADDWLNV